MTLNWNLPILTTVVSTHIDVKTNKNELNWSNIDGDKCICILDMKWQKNQRNSSVCSPEVNIRSLNNLRTAKVLSFNED